MQEKQSELERRRVVENNWCPLAGSSVRKAEGMENDTRGQTGAGRNDLESALVLPGSSRARQPRCLIAGRKCPSAAARTKGSSDAAARLTKYPTRSFTCIKWRLIFKPLKP